MSTSYSRLDIHSQQENLPVATLVDLGLAVQGEAYRGGSTDQCRTLSTVLGPRVSAKLAILGPVGAADSDLSRGWTPDE